MTTPIALDGKVVGLRGSVLDVTQRKKMDQSFKLSEEKFHSIANSVKDALILVDNETRITYWNPAAEKMFGYKSEECIGKLVHDLVVPSSMCREGKERIAESVQAFEQTGVGYFSVGTVEVMGSRKDKSEFPAKLTISPMLLDEKWNAVGVVKDVTQTKKEEQKLREAEERYHALFNQAPLGILIIDPETAAFVEFNDIAALQLGYTREEFKELTIFDITAESNDIVKSRMSETLRTGGWEFESKHQTRNGIIRNVLVSALTLRLAGKHLSTLSFMT